MKQTIFWLVISFVFLFSIKAKADDKIKLTLNLSNVTVGEVLKEIQKKAGINFIYSSEQLSDVKNVSIKVENTSIETILDKVLANTGLYYIIEKDVIAIVNKTEWVKVQSKKVIYLKGKVIDKNGEPIIGASITDGTNKYFASTDVDGCFNFKVNGLVKEAQISSMGYKSYDYRIQGSNDKIKIVLEEDSQVLDNVVVTGYQEVKRERMTGSVSKINPTEILNKGIASIDQALAGSVSGLVAIESGRPGEDARITIRGANSLTGSTDPIWIVDGMPLQGEIPNISGATDIQSTIFTSGIGNINPSDIESITVLKDAAASAIYGARAANGVIVVKTKHGMVGKTIFSASANYGIIERPTNTLNMMNTSQKIEFEKMHGGGYGRVGTYMEMLNSGQISQADFDAKVAKLQTINTDWFKEIYRIGQTQQYNFSMSGGTEKTQQYTSLNYLKEKGIEPNNLYDKLNMNTKITHTPRKNIIITGGLSATLKNNRSSASNINPLYYAIYANPYERPYKEDGSYDYDLSYDVNYSKIRPGYDWEKFNIIDDLNRNTSTSRYLDAEMSLKFEWEFLPGITFTTQGVYNINSNNGRIIEGVDTYTNYRNNWFKAYTVELPLNMVQGSLTESSTYSNSYNFRNTLQYSKEFAKKHFVNLFLGQEISSRKSYSSMNYSPVFDQEHRIVGFPDMTGVDGKDINYTALGSTGKAESKLSSFFANASYSYLDKYVLSGSIRYDGSDIIGNDNQFTPLWNVSVRWNLHKENFLKDSKWVDELSLRTGFGYTGSIDKNAFPFVIMTLGQSVMYDNQYVPSSFRYPNPNVKWQTKRDVNIGFDLSMFNRRIELTTNFYYNTTMDVLDNYRLPHSSGRGSVIKNVADILNKGIEVDLGVTIIRASKVQWFVKGNIGYNISKLSNTYYKNLSDLPVITPSTANTFVEGYELGSWFGYKYAGVDPINGGTLIYTGNGDETFNVENVRNVTSNLKMPAPSYLGKKNPPVTGGLSTTLNYGRFILSASFDFMSGHLIKSFSTFSPLTSRNRHVNDLYSWRQEGDITNIPIISDVSTGYSKYMYDNILEKGKFFRCSLVSLGYNIPSNIISKIGFTSARFSITARDLFILSPYSGIYPTLMGNFGYPNTRKYTATLSISF